MTIPGWDRHGLERLVRYCARPPLSQERLGRLDAETLIYHLRRPTVDGRTELLLTPLDLLDRLAHLVSPPRLHKHRYYGVLAPNARATRGGHRIGGSGGCDLQLLQEARAKMDLPSAPRSRRAAVGGIRLAAARCWALLLARIYECLPLLMSEMR